MSSKKKPRPLFEVPVDIETVRESGWVYKSAEGVRERTGGSIVDSGADVLALGLAALAQTFVLGVTIAAIPWTIGLRALQSYAKQR